MGLVAVAVMLVCAGCGGVTPLTRSSCVTVPKSPPQSQLVASGESVTVRVGTVLYVFLIEPEEYSNPPYPSAFPWQTPVSASPAVLRRVRLCPSRTAYSLSLTITAFRALAAGHTTLSADLVPSWHTVARAPRRYRAIVIVKR